MAITDANRPDVSETDLPSERLKRDSDMRDAPVPRPDMPRRRKICAPLRRHDRLATRIALTIVGAIMLTQVIGFLLFVGGKWPFLLPLRDIEATTAAITAPVRQIAAAPAAARRELAITLGHDGMRPGWQEIYQPQGPLDDRFPAHILRDRLRREFGGTVDLILLETIPNPNVHFEPPPLPLPPIFAPRPPADLRCRLWLRLQDGSWATLEMPEAQLVRFNPLPLIASWALSLAAILWLSLVVAKRVTRPLHNFALAAERLGTDLDQAMLPETGPVELRQATRAFNRMQARLKRFIDDRTQMLAAISHDLRTPISRLRLRANTLAAGEDRSKMITDLRLMERMITATLDFVRDDTLAEPQQQVDLGSLIDSLVDDAAMLGGNIRYGGPAYATCRCRPLAIGRALGNIIDNALKYAGEAVIDLTMKEDAVRITIDDPGPGIPPSALDRVFDPFFRLDPARGAAPHAAPVSGGSLGDDGGGFVGEIAGEPGGSGLGLSIARNVILAHGGEITLINRPAGGLRVAVTLPRGLASEAAMPGTAG
ncbi:MAG TPA: ATP-binding protein [Dongiaceae bacterium]|nr:ATP-binding protein [Dongiaceae bacterium]